MTFPSPLATLWLTAAWQRSSRSFVQSTYGCGPRTAQRHNQANRPRCWIVAEGDQSVDTGFKRPVRGRNLRDAAPTGGLSERACLDDHDTIIGFQLGCQRRCRPTKALNANSGDLAQKKSTEKRVRRRIGIVEMIATLGD